MNDILKSKRFWLALIGGLVNVLVVLVPDLEPYASQIIESVTVLVGLAIGGFSLQDAVIAFKTGTSKYSNGATDD